MGHVKQGFGPREPQFPYFDAPPTDAGMYDGRPTRGQGAKSPRQPVKLRSNSDPSTRRGSNGHGARNTMANRRNGGGGMYWNPFTEGVGQ